ncbi:uncharacterized protein [Rhodnius prolixus]|uniref:uncharacterized protein n=1 Tax=Rhodnius prolixus TaxID=13249 RepID=UPI003D18A64B
MQSLTDDALLTLFCEVEYIINSRPLTLMTSDPSSIPLTPNRLLLMKEDATSVWGLFGSADNYCRRRWRQVQYLADVFWQRWRYEYLLGLQERQKWFIPKRNLKVGDLVIVVDKAVPRCQWPMGRITAVKTSEDGCVKRVVVRYNGSEFERPLSKLIFVLEDEFYNQER